MFGKVAVLVGSTRKGALAEKMELCCNFSQKGGGGHPNSHKMIFYGLITFLWLDNILWLDNFLVGWISFYCQISFYGKITFTWPDDLFIAR